MAENFIDGSCLTVTGNTLEQNLDEMPGLKDGQEIIVPLSAPIKETGHLTIFRGNIAKDGSVVRQLTTFASTIPPHATQPTSHTPCCNARCQMRIVVLVI